MIFLLLLIRKNNNCFKWGWVIMSYHFNSTTGKSAKCNAKIKECPLIHGNSPEEAAKNYEDSMIEHTFTKLKKEDKKTPREFQQMSSEILLKTPLKNLDTVQLSQTIRYEAIAHKMEIEQIDSAIALASILHSHQKRGPRANLDRAPYIEHPLRNTLRLIRLGVEDQDITIAALLHDTIEDGSIQFVKKFYNKDADEPEARKLLSEHIKNAYGQKVEKIVQSVTNEYMPLKEAQNKTIEQKHKEYRAHVIEQINKDSGSLLVKLSDFIDNATGLYHTDVKGAEKATYKRAVKYLPLIDDFKKALNNQTLPLSKNNKDVIDGQLDRTKVRLTKIIDAYL